MSASEIPRTSWLDAARRLQRIGVVLARHGFGEIVARIGVVVPRLPGATSPAPSSERLARRLADALSELGPTYIKLGQLLATRADLFPPEVVRALSALHASVRPMPPRLVTRTLDAELGQPHQHAFARFEPECLAAASIAQVHRATLHDGTEVVVKLQRPSLRAQVDADLAIMLVVARLLEHHVPEVAAYAPVSLVEAFASSIVLELDFRNEAENARRLRELLREAAEVQVPRVYETWTTERMLVMEYVPGTRLALLPEPARAAARQALLRAFARQTIEHGVFHADPHPGNLLALPDGRVALLDHGMVAALPEYTRTRLARLCLALVLRRHAELGEHVIALSNSTDAESIDRRRLEDDIATWLRTASCGGSAGMLGQLMTMSRVHRLHLPAALLSLMRMLAILDGVLRGLDPAGDVVRDLRRELVRAFARQLPRATAAHARRLPRVTTRAVRTLAASAGARAGALRPTCASAGRRLVDLVVRQTERLSGARRAARQFVQLGARALRWLAQTASRNARRVRALPNRLI